MAGTSASRDTIASQEYGHSRMCGIVSCRGTLGMCHIITLYLTYIIGGILTLPDVESGFSPNQDETRRSVLRSY